MEIREEFWTSKGAMGNRNRTEYFPAPLWRPSMSNAPAPTTTVFVVIVRRMARIILTFETIALDNWWLPALVSYGYAVLVTMNMVLGRNAFPILLGISRGKISMFRMFRIVTTPLFSLGYSNHCPWLTPSFLFTAKSPLRIYELSSPDHKIFHVKKKMTE
jgi:hypothetical protein